MTRGRLVSTGKSRLSHVLGTGRLTGWKDRSRADANTSNNARRIESSQVAVAEGLSEDTGDVDDRKELKRARAAKALGQLHARQTANGGPGSGDGDDPALCVCVLGLGLIVDAETLAEGGHDNEVCDVACTSSVSW